MSAEQTARLRIVLVLTAGYLAAELLGALFTGSLALLADAGHMLVDVGGLALALFAINFARRPTTPKRTYGFYRAEILAALTNSVVLLLLSAYVIIEAYGRLFEPPEIQSLPMTIVAAVGLAVNLAGVKLLGHHSHHGEAQNLNVEGARLEVLSDALGSIGVIVAGVIIMTTGFYLADPIASIGLALFILPRTWSLMKKSIHILMEGVPSNISYESVRDAVLGVKGVTGLFELHIWSITSGMDALSAHVVVIDPARSQAILQEITSLLEKRFNITHATIQIESYHPESSQ